MMLSHILPLASAADLAGQLGHIFYYTVLPILLVAGLGYTLQKRLGLDMPTLVRLNFYFIIPPLVYVSILTSKVDAAQVGTVLGFCGAMQVGLWLLVFAAATIRRVPRDQRRAMLMSTMLYNSGNYGLPLQDLAFKRFGFGDLAASLQIFVMLFQNVLGFTVGVFLVSGGRKDSHWREQLMHIVKFPPLYAITAALVTIQIRTWLGDDAPRVAAHLAPFWQAIQYVKGGFFAIALCTLGAQLATVRSDGPRYPVTLTVLLRLLAAPALALGVVHLLGLRGLVAQVLLISTATPTAVNAMLLCLEFKNHPDFTARSVFYSTLLSPVTVTLVIFVAQGGFFGQLAMPEAQPSSAGQVGAPSAGAEAQDGPRAPMPAEKERTMSRKTVVSIEGRAFAINGRPTYEGRSWRGAKIEGLLMNSRMVQGIFDDLNPATRDQWAYPDGPFDAERNTREFLAAMPEWRRHGLLSFTICLQGGSPCGYSRIKDQTWHNSAFEADGSLRPQYMIRLERILDRADELGMAPIVGYFYFGQDHRLADDEAVIAATKNATDWLIEKGYTNVLIEIGNEVNIIYRRDIIKVGRCHELIRLVQDYSAGRVASPAGRLLVSASMSGGAVPPENIVAASDFLLLHGNSVKEPDRIREMVDQCRASAVYRDQPIVFNEDDHFDFDRPDNNMAAAVSRYAGWGFFDYRMQGEGFDEGYQSVPVNWGISSDRKRGFFRLLAEMTGAERE